MGFILHFCISERRKGSGEKTVVVDVALLLFF
jgi:hypothetical protein